MSLTDAARPWEVQRRGLLLLVSSPSGAGKTSLSRRLVSDHDDLVLSISATTRAPRPGEEEGREYYFVSPERFEEMVEGGQLLEWAHVHDNRYGTPKAPVEAALAAGRDVLFDIDWQGAAQVRQAMPEDSVSIFVLPPSWADLARRLNARAQDSDLVIHRRLERGREEITHWEDYDYVIVNKNFDRAYADLGHIYRAERMKPGRNPWLPDFVARLGSEPLS
ncbi:MAG: guanylate kinase [Phenylobacterium sp.]|jgi:guanylate kinase|uniref:guanylate kinase n=1 Tax=Phenylobacterium sp. TaxID=1871053 RepID=UPI0025E1F881|nr:guanylate kinase [Phenylobacterium sp.]MCA3709984.1 guanylate kinase [Phenylobacterium sp.]MCA3712410.1 guanylate kinase [Phenylobacterium sp.]MCA3716569.1 guanylate kinase [Phenylobacterium sp.]MCA3722613.1 guanylate kinase [Phenylobacterium sp.]MCA3725181.1 guanylate kinase [Phenylobacterium sp.]